MSQKFDNVFTKAYDFVLARALVGADLMQMLLHDRITMTNVFNPNCYGKN